MMRDLVSENAELTEMCQYVISSGGKRLRPALCLMSYGAVGGKDMDKPVKVGAAFEIIHSATLIHDDINDQGEIRRGRKTLHKEYTVSKAIIAGDYMFAMGFRLLAAEAPQIVDYIVEASASMGAGEFVQKDFEHASSVREEDYIRIITGKTAKLFEASSKSGAAVANADCVILNDDPKKILTLLKVAKKTKNRAGFNIAVSLAVKIAVMIISVIASATALFTLPLWVAVLADSGLALLMILSSLLLGLERLK